MVRRQNKRYPNGFNGQGGLDLSRLATNQEAQQAATAAQEAFNVVMFDGRPFRVPQEIQVVPYLEMAYRARRGDHAAALTLTTFGIQLWDAARRPYWPLETPAELTAAISGGEADAKPQMPDNYELTGQSGHAQALAPAEPASAESSILLPPGVEV